MTSGFSGDKRLRPTRLTAAARAEVTRQISKDLLQEEAELRSAKTEKLRLARLEMEARRSVEVSGKTG